METIETTNKTACRLSIATASLLIVGGIWLCGYLLKQIPVSFGLTISDFVLWEIIAIVPIIAGGAWLRHLYRKRNTNSWRKGTVGGLIFGAILTITGLLLFAFNSGTLLSEWKPITISWQMLLIILGIINLWKPKMTLGIILISVGTFFIIPRIENMFPNVMDIHPDFIMNNWPILIVIAGVSTILGMALNRERCNKSHPKECRHNKTQYHDLSNYNNPSSQRTYDYENIASENEGDGKVNFNLIFSGSEHIFFEPIFNGGHISTVFGGMSLDLRRTTLPQGTTYLKVESIFGGVEIKAPEDWSIEIRSSSIFGGFSDSRNFYKAPENNGQKLIIIAECIFGGGEIQ